LSFHLLFRRHLLRTARPASVGYRCSWLYPAPPIFLLHLWSLGNGLVRCQTWYFQFTELWRSEGDKCCGWISH
jgi:hypothetical protein